MSDAEEIVSADVVDGLKALIKQETDKAESPEVAPEVAETEAPEAPDATGPAVAHADATGVDLSTVEGTGVDGRITKADVTAAANAAEDEGRGVPGGEPDPADVREEAKEPEVKRATYVAQSHIDRNGKDYQAGDEIVFEPAPRGWVFPPDDKAFMEYESEAELAAHVAELLKIGAIKEA